MQSNINFRINEFYTTFYSFKSVIHVKNIWIWLGFINLLILCTSLLWITSLVQIPFLSDSKSLKLLIGFISLMIMFAIQLRLIFMRDHLSRKKCQKEFSTSEKSIGKLETEWFKRYVSEDTSSYLSLANNLENYMKLRRDNFAELKPDDWIEYIFNDSSKNRIMTMFMGVSAAIIGLSISAGSNMTDIFNFFSPATSKDFLVLFIYFPITVFIAALELKVILTAISRSLGFLSETYNGKNTYNPNRTKVFIRELVRRYDFEKLKIQAS